MADRTSRADGTGRADGTIEAGSGGEADGAATVADVGQLSGLGLGFGYDGPALSGGRPGLG